MKLLPNGCRCSDINVSPANWNSGGKSTLLQNWFVFYRFYDDNFKDKYPKGRLVRIKGMNEYSTLEDRRMIVNELIKNEYDLLLNKSYNPITNTFTKDETIDYEIHPDTSFINALQLVKEKLKLQPNTISDLKYSLNKISKAAVELRLNLTSVKDIRRRHVKQLLEYCYQSSSKKSAHQFNKLRTYLMMLFTELVELETVEVNPVKEIKKMKTLHKIRTTLTLEERTKVDSHLHENHYSFWRFTNIFFHSGSREVELLSLQIKDVDLINQRYKSVIKKGKQSKEVYKTIKNIALPLWTELVQNADAHSYVFSNGLVPGSNKIRYEQIARRWRMHVKKKLKIKADFYSLKHSNLDEVSELLSLKDASMMASHTSTEITQKHYTFGEAERTHNRLKNITNKFA